MANEEQVKILRQGSEAWNEWVKKFKGHIDLSYADLSRANLTETHLGGVILKFANLSDSTFTISDFMGADLSKANLTRTDLRGVDLRGANLNGALLLETNFEGARFAETNIVNVDLSRSKGLEEIRHYFSSHIGTNTIQLSKGRIPVIFLRKCGLGDLDIEYAKLANPGLDPQQITEITYKIHQLCIGGGIQYYSCFISYNSKDQEFAQRLHDDLQNNGVRCWFAPEDLKIGDQIRPTIDRQIRVRDKLLVILSENSLQSEWVGDEVEGAIEEESKSNRLVLFPIRLDDTVLNTRDGWAAKIKRRRHIGDFSNWRDKISYQKAFERLLRDLKAMDAKA
jgi:hypothetical protein